MGKAKPFGGIQIDAGVIEFREAKARGRNHAVDARGSHRARRTVPSPGVLRRLEELVPIALMPHRFPPFSDRSLDRIATTSDASRTDLVACFFALNCTRYTIGTFARVHSTLQTVAKTLRPVRHRHRGERHAPEPDQLDRPAQSCVSLAAP